MIEIKVELYKSSLIVPAKMWSPASDGYLFSPMVFDTGASMTCISEEAAEYAGLEIDRTNKVTVTTGSGTIDAYYTLIPDLQLADISIGPVLAQVIKFPAELKVSALLGLNVIKEFSLNMDFNKNAATRKIEVDICMTPKFDTGKLCKVEDFNSRDSDQRFGNIYAVTKL